MQVNGTSGNPLPVDYQTSINKVELEGSTAKVQSTEQNYSDKVSISAQGAELLKAEQNNLTTNTGGTGVEPPQSSVDTGGTGIEPPKSQATTETGGTGIEPPAQGK